MNRFVKQNLMLITVMGTACVVALALLVYAGILYIEMRQCIMESQSLKMSIVELSKSDPAPIDANRPLLQKDIDHYKKLNRMISENIGRPYRFAAMRFIEILKNVKVNPEDIKNFTVSPIEGEKESDAKQRLEIARKEFAENERIRLIEEARKEFVEEYNSTVGKDENLARQGIAMDELRRKYRNTWDLALNEFIKMVTPLTQEPDLERYGEEFALFCIGIPRRMQYSTANLKIYAEKYQEKIRQMIGERMRPEADTLGFIYTGRTAEGENPEEAGMAEKNGVRKEDIPRIVRHWDIVGDICKRISSVKEIKSLNFFRIRGIAQDTGSYETTFNNMGEYTTSHYSFEVTGSLASIRELSRAFHYDPAVRRLYEIRSIFVYAPDSEVSNARQLLDPAAFAQEMEKKNASSQSAAPVRRGRRRGAAAEEVNPDSTAESAEHEMIAKMREEYEKREKSLVFHERDGYGEVKLGGVNEYRAVFDVDYIELSGLH